MKDLHPFFINPFDNVHISFKGLQAFTVDHIARMTGNPQAAITARIAPTQAALTALTGAFADDEASLGERVGSKQTKNEFLEALPAAINKIASPVETQFGKGSSQFNTCFPHGRTIFSTCTDAALEGHLKALVTEVTKLQPPLAASVVTAAGSLLTGWQAVYAPSETATGAKTGTRKAKTAAKSALALELYKNLLTIALQFPVQPEMLDLYMQPSLLNPHTPAPPAPAAPLIARDANAMWTFNFDGPVQTYVQIWQRSSANLQWTNAGDMQVSRFPAPDADIAPDGVTWWQVKMCGEDGDGNPSTPFSNVISFGPVPA